MHRMVVILLVEMLMMSWCDGIMRYGFGNSLVKLRFDNIDLMNRDEYLISNDDSRSELEADTITQVLNPFSTDDVQQEMLIEDYGKKVRNLQWHGTTTLAFKYKDAIVICVDSKASTGEYIASTTVKKVIPITSSIVATMAGGAADCYHNIRQVATKMKILETTMGLDTTVRGIAKVLQNTVLNGQDLQLGCMVAGIDSIFGPQLYYVDSSGDFLESDRFCVGSGSVLAYSALDSALSDAKIASMSLSDAIYHALWAVRHATVRDAFSGGFINVFVINKNQNLSRENNESNLSIRKDAEAEVRHVLRIDCKELDVPSLTSTSVQKLVSGRHNSPLLTTD